ncbi:MAG TPA: exopolysaccharide biosynthesis polyprenyl glycosylphosphotransferase [Terriglobales bacterium]|nr:exopolysaccharide biosynthesis polyprenyl glycosylphosphotransferase [Terriglobales bacterium]
MGGRQRKSTARTWAHAIAAAPEREIAGEATFLQMLSLERKRSERSGKPFLLVLMESSEALQGEIGERVVKQIQGGLFSAIRDIDVPGWYEEGSALGIIFTEMNEAQPEVIATIANRICEALTFCVDPAYAGKISVSCHVFPENVAGKNGNGGGTMRFYPDVPRTHQQRRSEHLVKRTIDVLGSLLALMLLSPVMLAIAALIKLTSPGPIFFRQQRVGQFGIPFTFLKFRSMHANNDPKIHQQYVSQLIAGKVDGQSGAPVFKIKNDPRVTRIGRFLRKTSLDELPQFVNVLKGEMSLVGPRPPIPYEFDQYDAWHRRRVLEIKPGITGLWQVEGRSKVTFDEMVRLDLMYARRWSIGMDLKILLMTPKAVFTGDGAC